MGVSQLRPARISSEEWDVPLVDLRRHHAELGAELRKALEIVVDRGRFILGEEVERFEDEFAAFCGCRECVGVSSGPDALTLSLLACGIGPGDEVIVPAHGSPATALAVIHSGATPTFCDVRADTALIDIGSAAECVDGRTAAIVAVHLYGQVCDMDSICEFADHHGLVVIEEATHAAGARFAGARAGSFGDAAAFGFPPTATLGALGDGGAVCTDDPMIADRIRKLRDLGRDRNGQHAEIGVNARLDAIQAAFLRVKLRHLDRRNLARRAWAAAYTAVLSQARTLWEDPRGQCVYQVFPVRVGRRDAAIERLRARGVEAAAHHWPALDQQPVFAGYRLASNGLSRSRQWSEEELSLPLFPELTAGEVYHVADALSDVLDDLG